ncbi:hypothetical protein GURKE_00120 [Brevundimonas phage vB_BpoS-Gurke]|uniref:Uncharacterized protein n=1 Tax=Brevundimonas phage vB_BpoS-Gurke TaxID=2948599 RepID=A0A9E7N1A2_9CAUD|nr:hypothetical protein GURKE_00120 [Brevundimonas phage vB_BpoS-Gurke]
MVPEWITVVYLVGAGLTMLFIWAQNFYTGSRDSGLMIGFWWFAILLAVLIYWAARWLRQQLDNAPMAETMTCTRSN